MHSATSLHPAHRVYIHPFYDNAQYTNNAAIVMVKKHFRSYVKNLKAENWFQTSVFQSNPQLGFAPRSLGSLSTSESCELIGWGGDFLNPRRDAVTVNSPDSCDPNYPQNFCTNFDSNAHVTCSAKQGSPLICGSEMVLAGFVTNVNGCTTNDAGQTVLNYHSIDDFRDWIEGVFGPELPKRNAVNFVVTVMERNVNSTTPRCYGTIISSSRVITTATCATIEQESFLTLELQTRIVVGSTASTVNCESFCRFFGTIKVLKIYFYFVKGNPSRIFIHPYFNPDNPFDYNVAVIEVVARINRENLPKKSLLRSTASLIRESFQDRLVILSRKVHRANSSDGDQQTMDSRVAIQLPFTDQNHAIPSILKRTARRIHPFLIIRALQWPGHRLHATALN